MWFLEYLLSDFQWFRKWRAGHWELWYFDYPVVDDCWVQNEHGTRPGLGRELLACENW